MGMVSLTDVAKEPCIENIALIAPLYTGVWYLAVRREKYDSIHHQFKRTDVQDKPDHSEVCRTLKNLGSIYVGKAESGTRIRANLILNICKVPSTVNQIEDFSYKQATLCLLNEKPCYIDAAFFMLPSTDENFYALNNSDDVCFVSIDQGHLRGLLGHVKQGLGGNYPGDLRESYKHEIMPNVCADNADYVSVFSWAFLVASMDTPDSLVKTAIDPLYQYSSGMGWRDFHILDYHKAKSILEEVNNRPSGKIAIHGASRVYYDLSEYWCYIQLPYTNLLPNNISTRTRLIIAPVSLVV